MIEVKNLAGGRIDKKFLRKTAKIVLKGERGKIKNISIALVGFQEIKTLNKKYRKKDKPTDVLSFDYGNSGEIVICPQEVKKNAEKFGNPFKKEIRRILIHGILHLLGHDHEKSKKEAAKMKEKENYYINEIF